MSEHDIPSASVDIHAVLKRLRRAWRSSGKRVMLEIVERYLDHPDPALQETARSGLLQAAQHSTDGARAANALVPILVHDLSAEDPEIQGWAAVALQVAVKAGGDITPALPALVANLSKEHPVGSSAGRAIWLAGRRGLDMESIRSSLEQALSSPDVELRRYAALSLSEWLQRTGREEPLPVHRSLATGGQWSPLRRSSHCGGDQPPADLCHYRSGLWLGRVAARMRGVRARARPLHLL